MHVVLAQDASAGSLTSTVHDIRRPDEKLSLPIARCALLAVKRRLQFNHSGSKETPAKMHLHRFLAHYLTPLVLTALTTSGARAAGPDATGSPVQATEARVASRPEPFRILAYATEGMAADRIPYTKLTHINYSFLIPNADGTFKPIGNPANLRKIVEAAHGHHVRVCIAVGGWGWDSEFEQMASGADTRTAFVANLARFIEDYGLDGADMDWESYSCRFN